MGSQGRGKQKKPPLVRARALLEPILLSAAAPPGPAGFLKGLPPNGAHRGRQGPAGPGFFGTFQLHEIKPSSAGFLLLATKVSTHKPLKPGTFLHLAHICIPAPRGNPTLTFAR